MSCSVQLTCVLPWGYVHRALSSSLHGDLFWQSAYQCQSVLTWFITLDSCITSLHLIALQANQMQGTRFTRALRQTK